MKKLGGILISALVLVLTGFVIFSVGTASLGTNKNNVAKNITLSIEEARELVEKAYTACKGDSSISTAAAYDKEYVEGDVGTWAAYILRYFEKIFQKVNVDEIKGNFKYQDNGVEVYVSYELIVDGLKGEMFWFQDEKICGRSFVNLYYENNNRDYWGFSLSQIDSSDGNFTFINDETEQSFNNTVTKLDFRGVGNKLRKANLKCIKVNQSFFGDNAFNKDNVLGLTDQCIDAINHEEFYKGYEKDESVGFLTDQLEFEDFTDAEINQLAAEIQNHVKTNYTRQVSNLDKYVELV